jgi:hypothetical protein
MQNTEELLTINQKQEDFLQTGDKIDFFTIFNKIDEIIKQAGGLNDLFFDFARPYIELLSDNLGINQTASALFAVLCNLYDGGRSTLNEVSKYLQCKNIQVLSYMDEFETLEQKKFIHIKRINEDFRYSDKSFSFEVRLLTIESLRKGHYHDLCHHENLSIIEFFRQLGHLCKERVQQRQSNENTRKFMRDLLNDNEHLFFVQKIQKPAFSDDDTFVLLRFFHYLVNLDEPEMSFEHLEVIFEDDCDFTFIKRQLKSGDYILLKKELIENTCSDDGFENTDTFRLTDKTKEEFLVELATPLTKIPMKGLKKYDSIATKNLFYPEKTQHAIDELVSLLQPMHFVNIQKRLSENKMRTGFACLFSGGPGTGKTETAYQMARISGRDIMPVDIAETKSKWFGESEKQIKAVFDKYRSFVRKCEVTPILLFNGADAILGRRQLLSENRNGPAQTENAIQNIILQEIENLDGILIATTNLSKNMDSAFERRFLYKIEFEKPEVETRKVIWRSLILDITEEDAVKLASSYDFSGGQIENISRKSAVHHVLSGKSPSLDTLLRLCSEESCNNESTRKIGFNS